MQWWGTIFPVQIVTGELLPQPTVTAAAGTRTTEYDPSQICSAPGCHHHLHSDTRYAGQSPGEDARILERFHMKCQHQTLGIRWQDHVRYAEVTIQTGLPSVIDHIVKRRNAIFGHIARMPSNVPVHQALSCQVDLSLGRPPGSFVEASSRSSSETMAGLFVRSLLRAGIQPTLDPSAETFIT